MRVFVDTSVWISFFRKKDPHMAERLDTLLDEDRVALAIPVRLEILLGASGQDRARLAPLLSALPTFYPTDSTWTVLESWIRRAGRAGQRFGFGDLLIGAIAAENDGEIWSLDRDFARMADLGLLKIHS